MNEQPVIRDERDVAVEDKSYRIAYALLVFGSLIICSVRGWVFHQSHWDLFGLVIVSGWIATFYQRKKHVYLPRTPRRWLLVYALVAALVAAAVGFVAAMLRK